MQARLLKQLERRHCPWLCMKTFPQMVPWCRRETPSKSSGTGVSSGTPRNLELQPEAHEFKVELYDPSSYGLSGCE
jgi:hypothetical protein